MRWLSCTVCVSGHVHAHVLVLFSLSLVDLAIYLVQKQSDLEDPMTDSSLMLFRVLND